jgi:hypothetical protein
MMNKREAMKLVITTQYTENYGDAEKPYWKLKGGSVYAIENLTQAQAERGAKSGLPNLSRLIESKNSMSEEYIVDVLAVEDAAPAGEPWDTVIVLKWNGREWLAREVMENEEHGYMHRGIARAVKTWVMLPEGERKDYKVVYTLRDGREAVGDDAAMKMLEE